MKNDYIYQAKCVRVLDGDTVELNVDLGFGLTLMKNFRLTAKSYSNFDTFESYRPDTSEEKIKGLEATGTLSNLVLNKDVHIGSIKLGKYRYVCTMDIDGVDVGDYMIELGYNKAAPKKYRI